MAVDVGSAQLGNLGDPQAGGIGGHENGAVLEVGEGREEADHFFGAEDDGEGAGLLGRGDALRDVVAAQGHPVEEARHSGFGYRGVIALVPTITRRLRAFSSL